ncbi:hypothetical protein BDV25DRAFT_162065 [Aspergillus avenaceus]|uniref:Aminotransferase class V domain-containing protein n=1 Tax=Aspergillus avenaceus TaxID=36643 RepID=A0A5N6TKN9_ASPAV|nr:hypothetical protein BDV25DRAFT_162065 [Aspergillus avenaceus]
MFPLDIKNIDAPYYVGNCHKWMCAPRGIGFVYARKDRRRRLRPLVIARSPYADDAHKHSASSQSDRVSSNCCPWGSRRSV